jgi:hypothetical protein
LGAVARLIGTRPSSHKRPVRGSVVATSRLIGLGFLPCTQRMGAKGANCRRRTRRFAILLCYALRAAAAAAAAAAPAPALHLGSRCRRLLARLPSTHQPHHHQQGPAHGSCTQAAGLAVSRRASIAATRTRTLLYDASAPTPEVPAGREWHHRPPPLFISQLSVSWFEVGGPCRPLTQPSLHCAPLALAPPRPPRQGNLPSLSAPRGRELCFLRPIHRCWCWSASLCQRAAVSLVAAPGFHRLWPCPLPLALGPDSSPKRSPDAPDASERQRTPCVALPHRRPRRLPPPWPFAASALVWVAVMVVCCAAEFVGAAACFRVREPAALPRLPSKSHVSLPTWDTAQRVVYSALGFSHSQAPLGAARRDKDGLAARLKQRADCSEAPPHQRDHSCLEHREVC